MNSQGMDRLIRTPEEFIENHNRIRLVAYCEALIYPNGDIQYAIPSHTKAALRLYARKIKVPMYDVMNHISIQDYSESWLLKETGCIFLWYHYYAGTPNEKQMQTIKKLIKAKIVAVGKLEV